MKIGATPPLQHSDRSFEKFVAAFVKAKQELERFRRERQYAKYPIVRARDLGKGLMLLLALLPGVASAQAKLTPPHRDAELRAAFPRVDDPAIQRILDDPSTVLYTAAEMPTAYQHAGGVHWALNNISADPGEPVGNANPEFPWKAPGGTHAAAGVTTVKFLWLPKQSNGQPWPIAIYKQQQTAPDGVRGYPGSQQLTFGHESPQVAWMFPVGATLGEVLFLPSGHAFELRIRQREINDWHVDLFRPFIRADDLPVKPIGRREVRVFDSLHPQQAAIDVTETHDVLPAMDPQILVGRQFQSALSIAFFPTTDSAQSIIPRGYLPGAVGADRESCFECHKHVGKHVSHFDLFRDWYGVVRGSDGIFSWHPFALDSISRNGFTRPIGWRDEFERTGMIVEYQPGALPSSRYRRLEKFTP